MTSREVTKLLKGRKIVSVDLRPTGDRTTGGGEQTLNRLQRAPSGRACAFLIVVTIVGGWIVGAHDSKVQAAGDDRAAEVRALEKIAAQLDRINDTIKGCGR